MLAPTKLSVFSTDSLVSRTSRDPMQEFRVHKKTGLGRFLLLLNARYQNETSARPSRYRSASSAAMQPAPAEVIA